MESNGLQNMIKQDLTEMMDTIEKFFGEYDQAHLLQDIPIGEKAGDVLECVEMLVDANTRDMQSSAAFRALTSLGALNSQLSYLTARMSLPSVVQQTGQAVKNAWNNLKSYLQNIIQSISTHLWQLISNILTPTEWSVSGNAGVSLFGLSGTAEVEITFG